MNENISLCAKWMKSPNASSKDTRLKAKKIIRLLGINERSYRKLLSALRSHIGIVENMMSSKKWTEIDYPSVPSKANLIYNNAFLRQDEERRRAYLASLSKGETKINAGVLFPHDIVQKYYQTIGWHTSLKNEDATLEQLWKALPDLVQGDENTMVVADGSGSMTLTIGNTKVMALSVANAIAIYLAERSSGQFKDQYITFSNRPQLVDFSNCGSLREKLEVALRHNEVASTNIEATFDLILKTAINKNMKQEELPKTLIIISDMEMNQATSGRCDQRLFEVINRKYINAGYKMPKLVFWNVNSRSKTIPIVENELGVILLSGYSVNLTKMALSQKLDPYEALIEQLMSERYACITI